MGTQSDTQVTFTETGLPSNLYWNIQYLEGSNGGFTGSLVGGGIVPQNTQAGSEFRVIVPDDSYTYQAACSTGPSQPLYACDSVGGSFDANGAPITVTVQFLSQSSTSIATTSATTTSTTMPTTSSTTTIMQNQDQYGCTPGWFQWLCDFWGLITGAHASTTSTTTSVSSSTTSINYMSAESNMAQDSAGNWYEVLTLTPLPSEETWVFFDSGQITSMVQSVRGQISGFNDGSQPTSLLGTSNAYFGSVAPEGAGAEIIDLPYDIVKSEAIGALEQVSGVPISGLMASAQSICDYFGCINGQGNIVKATIDLKDFAGPGGIEYNVLYQTTLTLEIYYIEAHNFFGQDQPDQTPFVLGGKLFTPVQIVGPQQEFDILIPITQRPRPGSTDKINIIGQVGYLPQQSTYAPANLGVGTCPSSFTVSTCRVLDGPYAIAGYGLPFT